MEIREIMEEIGKVKAERVLAVASEELRIKH